MAIDKIPQFVKQCWEDEKPNGLHSIDTGLHFNLEKYTELIVRECSYIADGAEPYKANDLILKHFGINLISVSNLKELKNERSKTKL